MLSLKVFLLKSVALLRTQDTIDLPTQQRRINTNPVHPLKRQFNTTVLPNQTDRRIQSTSPTGACAWFGYCSTHVYNRT